jgi:putative ATP-dependent endonuclease of OLD family
MVVDMGRVTKLLVRNYKSVRERIELVFPKSGPLVIVGPNNTGKSNLMRALELVLGESWPGSYQPEDHDFHGRDQANLPLEIIVEVEDVKHAGRYGASPVRAFLLRHTGGEERPYSMIIGDGSENLYVSNETRDQCRSILISADRRLSYQLGYSSKYTFLSKLTRQFHHALTEDKDRVKSLKAKFEEIRGSFEGIKEFATFTEELQKQMDDFSRNLEYRLEVDFSAYDPSNYFRSLRVQPVQDGEIRTLEELGTGQEQVLALSFAYAYAKAFHGKAEGLVLIIEEPEAHLHPLAQQWVSRKVHEFASVDGIQVVITTHSPAFLSILNLEGLVLASKENGATRIKQLSKAQLAETCIRTGAKGGTSETILPFYAAAATQEVLSGFFARKLILVEGPTESLALPLYLERIGLNPLKEGIAVIPVHGVGNLAKWWRFFTAYEIPTYPIFDNDAKDDPDQKKRSDLLTALGFDAKAQTELLNAKEWIVLPKVGIFGKNFEESLRLMFGEQYLKLEKEAQEKFGLSPERSKPLIARHVAETIPVDAGSNAEKKLTEFARAIDALKN